jgi:hypothetical protein
MKHRAIANLSETEIELTRSAHSEEIFSLLHRSSKGQKLRRSLQCPP